VFVKKVMSTLGGAIPRVVSISESGYQLWQDYVNHHAESTVYHLLAWRKIFERSFGYRSWYLLARDGETGHVVGCLPLFLISTPHFRRLVSVPFRDRGGPLWSTPEAFTALLESAKRIAGKVRASSIAERFEDKIGPKTRNMIRQAERANLTFHEVTHFTGGLRAWYDLYLLTQKHLGLPPFPLKFFRYMIQELLQADAIKLFLVRRDHYSVAATIVLLHEKVAIYGYSSSKPGAQTLRPNDFMLFNIIKWLFEHGITEFDLGSDAPSQKGLLFFKKKWLAKQSTIPVYTFGRSNRLVTDSSDQRHAFIRKSFRYLPKNLLRLIGSLTVKHFG
jgi:CelD/BcsL family acetyltransferase involved in cellulose biosynthesis